VKFARILFSGLVTVAVLSGCGPEDSRSDAIEDQQRENFQKARAALDPAVGTYQGFLINTEEKKNFPATMTIKHTIILVAQPSTGKQTRIPSLEGNLVRLKNSEDKDDTDLTVGLYDWGNFDGPTGEINLLSQITTREGSSQFSFVGTLNGNLISGVVSTPYRRGMKFEGTRE
jgi:hypothetical protein